jgi:hypothetical protein
MTPMPHKTADPGISLRVCRKPRQTNPQPRFAEHLDICTGARWRAVLYFQGPHLTTAFTTAMPPVIIFLHVCFVILHTRLSARSIRNKRKVSSICRACKRILHAPRPHIAQGALFGANARVHRVSVSRPTPAVCLLEAVLSENAVPRACPVVRGVAPRPSSSLCRSSFSSHTTCFRSIFLLFLSSLISFRRHHRHPIPCDAPITARQSRTVRRARRSPIATCAVRRPAHRARANRGCCPTRTRVAAMPPHRTSRSRYLAPLYRRSPLRGLDPERMSRSRGPLRLESCSLSLSRCALRARRCGARWNRQLTGMTRRRTMRPRGSARRGGASSAGAVRSAGKE